MVSGWHAEMTNLWVEWVMSKGWPAPPGFPTLTEFEAWSEADKARLVEFVQERERKTIADLCFNWGV